MGRIKFLDGFRGIAVLLVIFFHMEILGFGFAGVELFFVISGFIISFLLIKEFDDTNKINIKNFFIRRISRILPPLIICTIVTLILLVNFPLTTIQDKVFSQAFFSSLGVVNFYELFHSAGYWEQGVKSPLLHLWSICIEMQFYLIWPFVMYLLLKKKEDKTIDKKRMLFFLLVLFSVLVGITYFYSINHSFDYLYYNPLTRISSFVVGSVISVLAFKREKASKKLNQFLILIVLISLGYLTYLFELNNINLFRGYIALYCVIFGIGIYLLSITHFKFSDYLLANKFILFIGKISYSLYLIHMPVIVFVSAKNLYDWFGITLDSPIKLAIIQLTISVILATVLYFIVESKIKIRNAYIATFLVLGFPALTFGVQKNPEVIHKFTPNPAEYRIEPWWISSDPFITGYGEEALLFIGDSWSNRIAFGLNLAQGAKSDYPANEDYPAKSDYPYQILAYGVDNGSIMNPDYTVNGDNPDQPFYPIRSFEEYLTYWQTAIDTYHPTKVIISYGRADQATEVIDGKEMRVGDAEFDERFVEQYQKVIDFFYENNIKIYLTNVINNAHMKSNISENQFSDAMNNNITEVVKNNKNKVTLLDLNNYLGDEKSLSPYVIDGIYIYDDTNHTTYEGSHYMGKWLLEEINDK
ncbi:acyltransferase family protein [Lysinibacillus sp. JNUCC 51]|uniref:acyltransferase family protein n=1 Tax=Lysinibacillus sp. JNUCC-51 TaxID=2792479 RepID=UPI001935DCA0|nr:acyltransferase [Lysinibacillus sp. JNUCC-51]